MYSKDTFQTSTEEETQVHVNVWRDRESERESNVMCITVHTVAEMSVGFDWHEKEC